MSIFNNKGKIIGGSMVGVEKLISEKIELNKKEPCNVARLFLP